MVEGWEGAVVVVSVILSELKANRGLAEFNGSLVGKTHVAGWGGDGYYNNI